MTSPDAAGQTDPLRTFVTALDGRARRILTVDYDVIRLIRAATDQGADLEQLAKLVGRGVGRYSEDDARRLMLFRLRRECGELDDESAATEGTWRA